MKVRMLYGSIICITCFFTVLIFLDFRKRWEASENFRQVTHNIPLSMRHLFIAPQQLKGECWQIGDFAAYHLRTNTQSRQITFHVAARDSKGGNQFWLRTDGLVQFNKRNLEIWRLLDNTNLRLGSEKRGFYFYPNAIPFPLPHLKFPRLPVVLEKLGSETIGTPIGTIECEHYFAFVPSPKGELEPLLELWANPSVRPLGIVRARWKDASMDLVQADTQTVLKIPSVLFAEFDRNKPLEGWCTRCHQEGIGGKHLKLESMRWLSGNILNLTSALFHHRQAKIVKQNNLIHIQLTEKSRRVRKSTLVRFSWENGCFWVKPHENGEVGVSLDAIAHQSNIIIQSSKGELALNLKK